MAYEISSSIAAGNVVATFYAARADTHVRSGIPSPDGTKIVMASYRHGGSGIDDFGLDIWHSSSGNGWEEAGSIDTGGNIPYGIAWYDNNEFYTAESDNKLRSYVTGSTWTSILRGTLRSFTNQYIFFSPNKTRLITTNQDANAPANPDHATVLTSGSTTWDAFIMGNSIVQAKIGGVTWASENDLIIGMPEYNSSAGRIRHLRYDGSSDWDIVASVDGFNSSTSDTKRLGRMLHYFTSSNTLIAGAQGGTGLAVLNIIQSSSVGYFPTSNLQLNTTVRSVIVEQDFGISSADYTDAEGVDMFSGLKMSYDRSCADRVFVQTMGAETAVNDDTAYVVIESGSDGLKFSQFENNATGGESGGDFMAGVTNGSGIFVAHGSGTLATEGFTEYRLLPYSAGPSPDITIDPTSLTLSEGQDGEITVVLDAQPSSDVVVAASLHADFDGRATLTNHLLTFTNANWNSAQTLQVTASQDSIANGTAGPDPITFSVVDGSSDDAYDGISATATLTVNDNETAGFTISPTSLSLAEGQDGEVSVVLDVQPAGNVVVTASLHNTDFNGRASLTNHILTFTDGNWNTPQILQVTASQDSLINGQEGPNNITLSIVDASSDDNYDPVGDQTVALTVTDNDTAGFTLGKASLTLTEGQDDTVSVVLDAQPDSNVIITASLHSNFNGRATLTDHLLTFTNGNWNVAQLLQVTASQDSLVNENVGPNNITFSIVDASSDNNFDALSDQNVALTVVNNDVVVLGPPVLGTLVASGDVITSETGGEDEMSVRLFVQPTHNVTVSISGVDSTEFTVSHTSLVFTSANWDEDQILRFKGLPDGSVDGDITTTITLTAASSDSAYNGISITKNVTNLDTTPSGGFADPCTLLSDDYTINYYTCALGQYNYHKTLPFRFGSAKNISNIREQTPAGAHKTFLGEQKS